MKREDRVTNVPFNCRANQTHANKNLEVILSCIHTVDNPQTSNTSRFSIVQIFLKIQ